MSTQAVAIPPEFADRYRVSIAAQQIEYVYRTIKAQLIANPVGGFFIVWLLHDIAPLSGVLAWYSVLLAVMGMRFLLWRDYWSDRPKRASRRQWGVLFAFTNVLLGFVWGGLVLIFFTIEHLVESMILIIAVAGFTAGSFSSHSAYFPAYVAFSAPAIGLVVWRLIVQGGSDFGMLAGLCLVYFLTLVAYARTAQDQIKSAIVTRLKVEELNHELTAQKEALSQAKAVAEKANLAKAKFLASASHDLRQPLHALRLFVDVLGAKSTEPSVRPVIENIGVTVNALEGLFSNLLELARADAQVIKPELVTVHLQELLARLRIENEPRAAVKHLGFRVRPTRLAVRADPILLERILRNLVSNAIRYTRHGRVLVACRQRGEQVRIEVWDTGIGIPPDEINRVFEEFHQIDNPERDRTKGLGLGLAIVEKLAKLIGARIEVHSRPGRGSCFSVTLPGAQAVVPESGLKREPVAPLVQPTEMCVVFIDDDPKIRQAMQGMLDNWSCRAIMGEDLPSVLRQLDEGGERALVPDIIVSDYRLRDERTGAEAIAAIRHRLGRAIPAIIITGDMAVEQRPDVVASGARVLYKPIKPAGLRILMERMVDDASLNNPAP